MQKLTFIAACCILFVLPVSGQATTAAQQVANNTSEESPTYEVVSIKPHKPGDNSGSMRSLPDGFEYSNQKLNALVQGAYGLIMENQILGLPAWASSESYDITAKMDEETAERLKHLPHKERDEQEELMLRSILEDRCQLKAHQEIRELPIYELVIAKHGLKMKEAPAGEEGMEEMSHGRITAKAQSVDSIVYGFAGTDGRLIVDKTGLGPKRFDFELRWSPDGHQAENLSDAAPSFYTALEEQLGLKLVPAKGPVPILVIDHMERPSPN